MANYLVQIQYVSPPDTLAVGEEPRRILYTLACDHVEDIIDFCFEWWDGQDYLEDKIQPEIEKFISKSDEIEYFFDDWSAGQWMYIHKILHGKKTTEINF